MTALNPPVSPRDPQRPATAADLASNPVLHRAWLDYLSDLHARVARETRAGLMGYIAGKAIPRRRGGTVGPMPEIRFTWEATRGDADHRPTFADALNRCCKRRHTTVSRLCKRHGVSDSTTYAARACERGIGAVQRARLAEMVGLPPEQIRWPIVVREGHHD